MELDFIVKLGGSAITNKAQFETAKLESIDEAAQVLSECYKKGLKFAVIHGAGSYGHHQAKQYSVRGGFSGSSESHAHPNSVKIGFSLTHISVTKLNNIIAQALAERNIPVVTVSPCGTWTTDNGLVVKDACDVVTHCLEQGLIPVLHGDCVFDLSLGCTILSGDTILKVFCEKLNPKRAIFLMDCAGIYNRPPHLPGSTLIPEIYVTDGQKLLNSAGAECLSITSAAEDHLNTSQSDPTDLQCQDIPDVTGGLRLKLSTAVEITSFYSGRIPVVVCSLDDNAFRRTCLLNEHCGTLFLHKGNS